MAITSISQPNFVVTTEAEKSTAWPEGSQVYVTDTGCYYILKSSVFIDLTSLTQLQGVVYIQALHYALI